MKKIIIVFVWFVFCYSNDASRVKRKVLFLKNSKVFLRMNGRDNVIPSNQLYAHGWTFRINWELPQTLRERHRFFKREIGRNIEDLTIKYGYTCIFRYFCEFIEKIKLSRKCGILCEIGNIMYRSKGIEIDFFQDFFDRCNYYIENCSD